MSGSIEKPEIFSKKLKKGVDKGGEIWYSLQARSRGGAERGLEREQPNLENDTEEKRARRKTAKIPKSFAEERGDFAEERGDREGAEARQ